jgi:hypothetical protein
MTVELVNTRLTLVAHKKWEYQLLDIPFNQSCRRYSTDYNVIYPLGCCRHERSAAFRCQDLTSYCLLAGNQNLGVGI